MNRHNLSPETISALESVYPPAHPKHRSAVLGQRGLNVIGEPVYKGAFSRALHEQPVEFNPQLPLDEAIDFGRHHPCIVWRQTSELGQIRYLGGIIGQNVYLEDFLPLVLQYRRDWFPDPIEVRTCCDPAGASGNSHGVRSNGLIVLEAHGFTPRFDRNSNAPDVRLAMIERTAGHMRRRTAQGEAFVVSPERWLRASSESVVPWKFLADGFEAGYVWDEHFVSVAVLTTESVVK